MTTEQIIGLVITLFVMFLGVAGSILPGLPSTPLVLVGALGHKIYFGDTGAASWVLVILTLLTLLSVVMDYIASVYGAKKLGATWRGAVGAVVGGLIGIFFSFPGILVGPFVGAVLFELAGGRTFKDSSKAGVGATIGLLAGALGKLACCALMIGLFSANVLYRSLTTPPPEKPAVTALAPEPAPSAARRSTVDLPPLGQPGGAASIGSRPLA